MNGIANLIIAVGGMAAAFGAIMALSPRFNLNGIRDRTVGHGQHGTARWASRKEIHKTYKKVPFTPELWRKGVNLPKEQGIVVGREGRRKTYALVDTGDVHALMIGAAGVGKTAFWLYPNLEYACASGMSFLTTDTKGDVLRNYGIIAEKCYGYHISVIDLRNPTRSDGNNILHLVNKYMDRFLDSPYTGEGLSYKAKAEKYAKIIGKTIIQAGGSGDYGQNAYFYDAAEGLLSATILLVAELCPPKQRHIVSVYKLIQELLAPSQIPGSTQFQTLMEMLPADHKARWFAGAALYTSESAMMSVMSTAMSRLNAFLDSELEQILCFDCEIDAERFCNEKSAIFVIMPEENPTTYALVSLFIQQLYREILSVADEMGGRLKNRCIFYCDEYGTLPKIESAEMMFSASRSRRLQIVPIIQSFAQLERNYGKEGADIIIDNTQLTIFGGFAPNSSSAETLSKALGSRTALSGSVSTGEEKTSQSLQMMERSLMTADELKSMPKGQFVVMKTGTNPMKVKLKLFPQWGITFSAPYVVPKKDMGQVEYANKETLQQAIWKMYKEEMQELFAQSAEKESGKKDTAVPKQQEEPIMMKSIPETKQE